MVTDPSTIPNVIDYTAFIRNVMGIPVSALPDADPVIQHSLDHSLNIVDIDIAGVSGVKTSWSPYCQAVYNLGGHLLVEFAADQFWGITSATWAAGIVSVVAAASTPILPGDDVTVTGLSPNTYNGTVQVLATPDDTHFTYVKSQPGSSPAVITAAAQVSEYFFNKLRRQLRLNSFVPGVVTSANDLSTGAGLLNPDFLRYLTFENLQLIKTPWGRAYLAVAQKWGPTLFGLS